MMKKYSLLSCAIKTQLSTYKSNLGVKNPPGFDTFSKISGITSLMFTLFVSLFLTQQVSAQASLYTFAQSNETYSPITTGTVVVTSNSGSPSVDSYVSSNITIPSFTFAGSVYTKMFITSNGQVALGTSTPSSSATAVLSSSTGGNVFIAPLSADLNGNTGVSEIRYDLIGNDFIVQWQNFRRYGRTESINFQVRMNISTGLIKFVYDGMPPYDVSTAYQPQVGIKSAVGSYSALTVAAGGNWNSPTNINSGIVSGSIATFAGNVGPTSGLTYTFTPNVGVIPNCSSAFVPANIATNVARNTSLSWISGSGNPTSYDVYFGTSVNPTFIGNQIATSYTPTFLAANTTYYWKIVPKNATGTATGCTEQSFTTGLGVIYCTPSSTADGTYINNFSTSLGTTNISNSSGYTTGGYQDNYSATAVTLMPTTSFDFDMTVTGGSLGAAIWVDWNSNGTFEMGERVFATTSYTSAPISSSVVVPSGTAAGNYRMRVMVDYNTSSPSNPCNTTGTRTETEDYKITVTAQNACSGTPMAATIVSSASSVCISGSVEMSATIPVSSDSGITYQWYNASGAIAGATAPTYTTSVISSPTSYYFKTTCTNSGLSADSNILLIAVNNPQVITTTPGSACGEGSVILNATASSSATLKWYSVATGGVVLGSGTTFTTPNISTTTDFYVEANEGEGNVLVGPESPLAQGGTIGSQSTAWNINFTVIQDTQLTSVDVFPITAGQTSAISLRTSTGTVITTVDFTTTVGGGATAQTVLLNFPLTPGNYQLYPTLPSSGVSRNITAALYPYTSNVASITGNGYDPLYFMGMYNWNFSSTCSSARTAVTATIDSAPALTLSSASSSICEGASTALVTIATGASSYDSFVWSPSTGVTGNAATGFIFSPTDTMTYTLTASQSTGSLCNIEVSYTVNVNQLPSVVSILPATAASCLNEIQALTASGGSISNTGSITIGNDTTLTIQNGLEPTAFCNRYEHYWLQMVFTQAELIAAGVQAGSINGVKFNITTIGSAAFVTDYRVKVGATSDSVLTEFTTTGLTEVFSAATYTQTIGVNSIVFTTPYIWDGTSNIILDIRNTGADLANNSATYYTATTANTAITARTSSTFASSDAFANSNPAGTLSVKRLNTTFDFSSAEPTDISWSPATNLFTDAAATVAYVIGNNANTVYVKSSIAGSQTYTATATSSASGCEASATVTITTTETAAPIAAAQSVCMGATVADLVATGTDIQWYNVATGGTPLLDTAMLATGMYYASQTMNSCESIRTSIAVTVNALPIATITRNQDTLTASIANATYQWVLCDASFTPITGETSQSFTATASGNYAVIVTQNGCTATSECFELATLSNNTFDVAKLGYYPNPVTDVLTVSHTDIISGIQVFDITGRMVRNVKVNSNEVTVDMVNMPASVYIVKVFTDNTSGEFKVIKK